MARFDLARLGRLQRPARAGAHGDQADTSKLSQMMSESAKEMQAMTQARPSVVEEYRTRLDEPLNASMQVTNAILSRMIRG